MRIRDWSSDVCSSDLKSAEILQHGILHIPYLEPRGAVSAQVTMNGQTIRVFGMHLDLSGLWRRRQAAAIIAYAGQQEGMPTVLMGDLNEWSAQGGCLRDFAHHFHFADCGKSLDRKSTRLTSSN